ncbi:HD-GYP domain-containing protein [Paludibacterium yongneupense]|uniref:HD-GYP domain-containing protein n=1 Tax=Paludibacterium yongneupense TaxID=400061 RepID=UPI00040578E3|nr:HD-GYP domain-containing protein [Paludibacterium yongneupense]
MKQGEPVCQTKQGSARALSLALSLRDRLTQLHSERVLGLSALIGRRCALEPAAMAVLRLAACFHDIGKIGVPDHILLKPARFDPEEWDVMKGHAEMGQRIIAETGLAGADEAARVIRHHHEHYDGSGYPDGLAGEAIPFCSRIISIADSYDAMAESRPYHPLRSHSQIMDILQQESGGKHDPDLMRLFCQLIESSDFKPHALYPSAEGRETGLLP